MARDDGKSIDLAELARLLAGESAAPAPKPTSAKVAAATTATGAAESPTLTNAPKVPVPTKPQPFTQPMTIAGQTPAPAQDPMRNKAVKPNAPAGYYYTWIGGTTTGSWKLYKSPTTGVGGGIGGGGGSNAPAPAPSTVVPGATGTSTVSTTNLAIDTFRNTLALYFGKEEMGKSWVNALYNSVSSFYKTGSTIDEALNLSLQDIRRNPELKPFTDRFKGLYALQDRLAKGEAIQVPTIAEFFKAESDMGDVMRAAGLGDLATQEFLGNILGTGKSVREVGNIISDVFTTIDNAPKALKDTLSTYFPGVDRVSLAKALLTGPEGAAELSKKVKQVSVLSAAKTQGLDVSMQTAGDIAAQGYGYQESLMGFGQVARELPTYQKLQEIETGKKISTEQAQGQLQTAIFGKDIQEQLAIEAAAQRELNRYRGQAGTIGSRSLASQNRGRI